MKYKFAVAQFLIKTAPMNGFLFEKMDRRLPSATIMSGYLLDFFKKRKVMKDFFTESDCDAENGNYMRIKAISLDKANRLLRERGKVVYTAREESMVPMWMEGACSDGTDTHTALLILIEPIAKDSAEKIVEDFINIREDELPTGRRLADLLDRAKKLREGK